MLQTGVYFIYLYIKKECQEISTTCGYCKKDLTTCNDTSIICVQLSPEVVQPLPLSGLIQQMTN